MTREQMLEILELEPNASWEEVETRHRDLSKVWHPDRFQNKERLIEMAQQKMTQINSAYDGLMKIKQTEESVDISAAFARGSSRRKTFRNGRKRSQVNQPVVGGGVVSPRTLAIMMAVLLLMVCYPAVLKLIAPSESPSSAQVREPVRSPQMQKQEAVDERAVAVALRTKAEEERETREYLDWISDEAGERIRADVERPTVEILDNAPVPQSERDKMYQLYKNESPRELPINETPALIDASIACNLDRVKKLLAEGALISQEDLRGDAALSWAVRRRCLPVVRHLLAEGADVNQASSNGFTPYVWAKVYGAEDIAKVLSEAGANTDSGVYWRRFDDDAKQKWLDYRHDSVCRSGRCQSKSKS